MTKRFPDVECIHYENGKKVITYIESPYNRFYEDAPKRKSADSKPNKGVITDSMDAKVHPITGKLMDSKSEFRKVTRAHNCEEVGTEKLKDRRVLDLPPIKEDIARAIRELEGG